MRISPCTARRIEKDGAGISVRYPVERAFVKSQLASQLIFQAQGVGLD
jgi:hypothetical protein